MLLIYASLILIIIILIISGLRVQKLRRRIALDLLWAIRFLQLLREIIENTQMHRGMVNAYLNGDHSFEYKITQAHQRVDSMLEDLEKRFDANPRLGKRLKLFSIKENWQRITEKSFQREAVASFNLHSNLIQQELDMMICISTSVGMSQQDGNNGQLDNLVTQIIPNLVEVTGQARGIGTGILVKKRCDAANRIRILFLNQQIGSLCQSELVEISGLSNKENSLIEEIKVQLLSFLQLIESSILQVESIESSSDDYYQHGTRVMQKAYELFDEMVDSFVLKIQVD